MAAALIMLFLVLAVQRRQLAGQSGPDVDALPGRTPHPEPVPPPGGPESAH